jgi:alpha-tubulin suppressor-like RCC1 family protein
MSSLLQRLQLVVTPTLLIAAFGCSADAPSPAEPESAQPLASSIVASTLTWLQVSASHDQNRTCGLTTDHRAYCWGTGYQGDGQPKSSSAIPVQVAGGLQFRQISTGLDHTCAVTLLDRLYCWGQNSDAQLGDGTHIDRLIPVPVGGTRAFRSVSAGSFHTCAVTKTDRALCWGENNFGMLGDGTTTERTRPTLVAGGRSFRMVTAGFLHSCGLTTSNQAFCWGSNGQGQLGEGTNVSLRLAPVAVADGRTYLVVSAGWDHTCGVTVLHRALCWGNGSEGQIGDGKTLKRYTPRAVVGGLSFERISAGVFHTCGETTGNRAYCWGSNTYGGLGIGEAGDPHLTPVAVGGNHFFNQVSAGGFHTCGIGSDTKAYCWGYNFGAAVGDGTREDRWEPTAVLGPS